jgi:hypothetical protein
MATENYGSYGELGKSQAVTPVSTDTVLIGVGACAGGELNHAYTITSVSDYNSQLDGSLGDGFNLSDLVEAAFNIAGINRIVLIPVSHSNTFNSQEYMGDAGLFTGVYAVEAYLRDNPSVTNLIVAPNVTKLEVLSALNSICIKADGHWQSFLVYDLAISEVHYNASGVAIPNNIIADKLKSLLSERARCVWGTVQTTAGNVISGAAVQACRMAASDAVYGVPARCGGNLPISIIGPAVIKETENVYKHFGLTDIPSNGMKIQVEPDVYVDWNDNATYTTSVPNCEPIEIDGKVGIRSLAATYNYIPVVTEHLKETVSISIPQVIGNQLSADGVCSWINYGGGNWCTWGDHTSAYENNTIADERGRFDNTIRMQMMITNRFQLKYRFSIDDPMDLGMRNDIIDEELTYLNQLVSRQALIGEPSVEFRAIDNGIDNIQRGEFTFTIATTPTIPAKYLNAKVIYTTSGLEVYTTGENA